MINYGSNFLYNAQEEEGNSGITVENHLFTFVLKRVWYSDLTDDPQHHQPELHTHPYSEVRFILKGKGEYGASGKRWLTVNAGAFIAFPAGTLHCIMHEAGSYSKFGFSYKIAFKDCGGENYYARVNDRLKDMRVYPYSSNAVIIIQRILWLARNPGFDYETNLSFLVLSLFVDMMNTAAAEMNRREPAQEGRVRKAVSFIEDTISSSTNSRQVAAYVNLSVKQLNRLFVTELGETVGVVINRIKRAKTQELLLDPQFSLEDIARIMRYHDKTVFVRAFKRAEGITPRQFRKNMRVDKKQS